ncbi:MAG TPA: DUF6173 family protein [Alphaproteobacteria bacterium]|nr:DUF6173 family protein [Alphaproteobacteria bacterium]
MTTQGSQPPARRVAAQLIEPGDASDAATSPAESTYRRLMKYIGQFEMQLDRDHEIGGRFVSFGDDSLFHIADVGYWNPDIITFDGFDQNGNRVKLIQHVSQLNVLLVAVRKMTPPAEPPRRIGFYLGKGESKGKP